MVNEGKYFLYKQKDISEDKKLFGCIAIVVNKQGIQKYKIIFEVGNDSTIQNKWNWMFRNKENETHIWLDTLNENNPKRIYFKDYIHIFNELMDKELEKQKQLSNIPKMFFMNSNDIYNYLKNKNNGIEPSQVTLDFFKNWLILKIALFFEQNPEFTFEFPLYKEYINNNPQILEKDPEYSVESFILDINEGIAKLEELDI